MLPKRVAVTGVGAITPVGNDVPSTWDSLIAGCSGVARITAFDPEALSVQIAGEVKNFEALDYIDPKDARRMDRNVQFAWAASQQAIKDAELVIDPTNWNEVGVVIGTAVGGVRLLLEQQRIVEERGPNRVSPHFIQNMIPDTATGQVAIYSGARGPNISVVSACATGGHALGEAAEIIRRGDAHTMIAGGTEAALLPVFMAGFINMRALVPGGDDPTKASKPFDLNRRGFVVAEGSCIMILEDLERAKARGARIYAELVGYGSTNDAFHLAAPADRGEGAARAMAMALRKSGLKPEDIDYINAHGTSTPLNDKLETMAIKAAFGEEAYRLAVSSTKSMTGHMMGAAGALESLCCVLAIVRGVIPPTINYRDPDPECDLDYVPNNSRVARVDAAMSNSMGLGGHNSCVIFRRYEG